MRSFNVFLFLAFVHFVLAAKIGAPLKIIDPLNTIPNRYILAFKQETSADDRKAHILSLTSEFMEEEFPNKIIDHWEMGAFNGFAAVLSPRLLQKQRESDLIDYIEADAKIFAYQACNTQSGATWGLTRTSERALLLNGKYNYEVNGQGVDAYIIDTGVYTSHSDFQGRASWGANFIDSTNSDCNGHGTHVAGTIGGATWGVAKKVTLIAVKVLDCDGSGTYSAIISGINWTLQSKNSRGNPSVANMSLGGPKSSTLDTAINAAVAGGVTIVVAAGNENQNACNVSPASNPNVITVGATGTATLAGKLTDVRASFSNFGTCVLLLGPGVDVTSAWIGSTTATITISGTSMASPHVAGAAALYLGENPTSTPAQVETYLLSQTTDDLISLQCTASVSVCNTTPNQLLFASC